MEEQIRKILRYILFTPLIVIIVVIGYPIYWLLLGREETNDFMKEIAKVLWTGEI